MKRSNEQKEKAEKKNTADKDRKNKIEEIKDLALWILGALSILDESPSDNEK